MLCEKCGQRQADVRFVQIENSKKTEVNLCQTCAQEYSGFASGFNLQNILGGMLDYPQSWGSVKEQTRKRCSTCQSSLGDIQKRGQLGCSDCYTTFQPEVDSLLRRIHSATHHIGKIPVTSQAQVRLARQIDEARAQLEECIRTENFEEAAQLRDEIRQLEQDAQRKDDDSEGS